MTSKDKKIIGYARVSTREQAENQQALEQQKARLEEAIARLVPEESVKILFDIESGNSNERQQFNKMLEQVRQGKITTIVATRWDRLTRNEILYLQLKEILRSYNITLILLDQGEVDLSTPFGELSADMQALFAVHERRMIRERVQKGHEHRRKKKVAWTRPPWGYVIKNDRYLLDTRPIVCSIEDRPSNYQDLAQEPDNSPQLAGVSKSGSIRRWQKDHKLDNDNRI
jgi:site-specific DNA recombinase